MQIIARQNDILVVAIKGWLDIRNSTAEEAAITAELAGITHLKIDFSELEYISSAGLRMLLKLLKLLQPVKGDLTILNANDDVTKIITMAGFDRFLLFE